MAEAQPRSPAKAEYVFSIGWNRVAVRSPSRELRRVFAAQPTDNGENPMNRISGSSMKCFTIRPME
jgi:hypothetical protein